jgi:hypothetical protein
MFQDWTWWCNGCGKKIEPYESHDIEKCYISNGVKSYQPPPLTIGDRLFVTGLLCSFVGVIIFLIFINTA